jgi:hypothetical protein
MSVVTEAVSQSSAFMLKHEAVELFRHRTRGRHATVAIQDLEAMRTSTPALSASRYSLETICGASCETGAQ